MIPHSADVDTLFRNIPDIECDLLQEMRKLTFLRHEPEKKAEVEAEAGSTETFSNDSRGDC
jgi:hypothetical protein